MPLILVCSLRIRPRIALRFPRRRPWQTSCWGCRPEALLLLGACRCLSEPGGSSARQPQPHLPSAEVSRLAQGEHGRADPPLDSERAPSTCRITKPTLLFEGIGFPPKFVRLKSCTCDPTETSRSAGGEEDIALPLVCPPASLPRVIDSSMRPDPGSFAGSKILNPLKIRSACGSTI